MWSMDKTFVETDEKFRKIHRKIPVLEFLFNKVRDLGICSFIEKWLQQRWFPAFLPQNSHASVVEPFWVKLLGLGYSSLTPLEYTKEQPQTTDDDSLPHMHMNSYMNE